MVGVRHRYRGRIEFLAIENRRNDDRFAPGFVHIVVDDREGKLRRAFRTLTGYRYAQVAADAVIVSGGRTGKGERQYGRDRNVHTRPGGRNGHGLRSAILGHGRRVYGQRDLGDVAGQVEIEPGTDDEFHPVDDDRFRVTDLWRARFLIPVYGGVVEVVLDVTSSGLRGLYEFANVKHPVQVLDVKNVNVLARGGSAVKKQHAIRLQEEDVYFTQPPYAVFDPECLDDVPMVVESDLVDGAFVGRPGRLDESPQGCPVLHVRGGYFSGLQRRDRLVLDGYRGGCQFHLVVTGGNDDRLAVRFLHPVVYNGEGQLRRSRRTLGGYQDVHVPGHRIVIAGCGTGQGQRQPGRYRQCISGLGGGHRHGLGPAAFGEHGGIHRKPGLPVVVGRIEVYPGAKDNPPAAAGFDRLHKAQLRRTGLLVSRNRRIVILVFDKPSPRRGYPDEFLDEFDAVDVLQVGLVPRFLRTVGAMEDHVTLVVQDKQVNGSVPPVPVLDSEDVQNVGIAIGPVLPQCAYVASHSPDDELLERFAVHDFRRRHLGLGNERGIVYGRFDPGHVHVKSAHKDDLVAVVFTEETGGIGYLGRIVFFVDRIVPGVIDVAAAQSTLLDKVPHHSLSRVVFEFEQALAAGGNVARVEQHGSVQEQEHEKRVAVFPVSFLPGAVEERRKRVA